MRVLSGVLAATVVACSGGSDDRTGFETPQALPGAGGTGGEPGAATGGSTGLVDPTPPSPSTPQGCAFASVESELVPANLLFMVDRSGSMMCNLPPLQGSGECEADPRRVDPSAPSKWEVITGALKDAVAGLPLTARAGVNYFSNDDVCGVQSAPSVGIGWVDTVQLGAFDISLGNVGPRGGTPIVGGTILAYKHLHQQARLDGNDFVVLITDGTDTCNGDQIPRLLNEEIPKARSVGIRTFAIGAPGSESARALLSRIAFEGGTARSPDCDASGSAPEVGDCHFDMTQTTDFAADLNGALGDIGGRALSCELEVPSGVDGRAVDLDRVNVDYYANGSESPAAILRDDGAPCDAGADGWQYNSDRSRILLCGQTCSSVKADSDARVEVVLGCETVVR